jgi:type VI protein secretion system component VasK
MAYDEQSVEDLLKENVRLTRENNRLVRKLWRAHLIGFWSRILLVAVLIIGPILLYRFWFAEYLFEVQNTYQNMMENIRSVGNAASLGTMTELIDSVRDRASVE